MCVGYGYAFYKKRPPLLGEAITLVTEKCGEKAVRRMVKNAGALFKGTQFNRPEPQPMRQVLGYWL